MLYSACSDRRKLRGPASFRSNDEERPGTPKRGVSPSGIALKILGARDRLDPPLPSQQLPGATQLSAFIGGRGPPIRA